MKINKALIDSDILLDYFLDRKPFSDDSSKILTMCEEGKLNGFITGVAIANIYYLLRKEHGPKPVLQGIKRLLTFLDVVILDKNTILKSIESDFSDFEDALQNFSAENQGNIKVIITRNIKDYKRSNLSVLNPKMFLEAL